MRSLHRVLVATRSLLHESDEPVLGSTPGGHALPDLAGPQVLGRALLDQGDELTDPLLVTLGDDLDASVAGVPCVADEPELERPRPGPPAEADPLHPTVHPDDRPGGTVVI